MIQSLMLPFHEPPPGQYNLLEKPYPGFLGSTSSSSPWFPFSPSVLHHEEGLHELLFSPLPPNYTDHPQPPPDPPVNKAVAVNGGATTSRPRRPRSLRKDRHSKICTAQGPRDRRMRLSLEVARRFFDLQDMLAFDKPSKTVQWLLNQAKSAIKEVESISRPNCQQFSCSSNSSSGSKSTESSTYESEDVSTISEPKGKLLASIANEEKVKEKEKEKAPKTKRAAVHVVRRATVDPALVRESRDKARARARERTTEKKKMRSVSLIGSSNEMLAPSAATDQALEESVSDHDLNSSLELVADVDEPCSHTHSTVSERVYGFLAMTSEPGHAAQDFDNSFLHEQWGMHFTGNTTTDEQVHAKQWFFNNSGSNLFL